MLNKHQSHLCIKSLKIFTIKGFSVNCQKVKFTMSPWPLVPALHGQTEDARVTIRFKKITLHLQFFNQHFLRCFVPSKDNVVLHLDEFK